MKGCLKGWGMAVAAAAAALLAGCAANTNFVYKPGAPAAGGPKVAAKVAVLPFKDGTEDFQKRGSIINGGHFNLAKAGITGTMTAVTPELWGKGFADDLSASGSFASARFMFSASEIADEEFLVEGTVRKAYWGTTWEDTNEFALAVSATRRSDNTVIMEKEAARTWKTRRDIYVGCGMGIQCMTDRLHGEVNKALQEMFAEMRADLVAAAAAVVGKGPAPGGTPATATGPPAGESAEQAIERILKGQ